MSLRHLVTSFVMACVLLVALWLWMQLPYNLGIEGSVFRIFSTLKHSIQPAGKQEDIRKRVLLVNTGHSSQLAEEDDGLGNSVISHRARIDSLLEYLGQAGGERTVVIDLVFERPSPDDDSLQATIRSSKGLFFPLQDSSSSTIGAAIPPSVQGPAEYQTTGAWWKLSDHFFKFSLVRPDNRQSLPLIVYRNLTGSTVVKKYGLLWINGYPSFNNVILDEDIRSLTLQEGKQPTEVYPIDHVLAAFSLGDSLTTASLLAPQLVIIGDFERDVHHTAFGEVPGPLILFNIISSLLDGDNRINGIWVLYMLVCFTGAIQFSIYGRPSGFYAAVLADAEKVIGEGATLLVKHLVLFLVIAFGSYVFFDIAFEVIAASVMFTVITGIVRKWPVVKERTLRSFRMGTKYGYMKMIKLTFTGRGALQVLRIGIITLVLFCLALLVSGQSVKVLKVNGGRAFRANGQELTKGSSLDVEEKIRLSAASVRIPVIYPGKGVFTISRDGQVLTPGQNTSELLMLVRNAMVPVEKTSVLAGRAGVARDLADLEDRFTYYSTDSTALVIFRRWAVDLDPEAFQVNGDNYFFIRYQYKGTQVNKKLSIEAIGGEPAINQLVFDSSVLRVDGKMLPPQGRMNWQLFFYSQQEKRAEPVAAFVAEMLQAKETIAEICILRQSGAGLQEVKDYLAALYGCYPQPAVDNFIQNFKCK